MHRPAVVYQLSLPATIAGRARQDAIRQMACYEPAARSGLQQQSSTRALERRELTVKKALVCGAGGFIGGHLVKRLKHEGFWVRGVDLKFHEYSETAADDFMVGDLRDQDVCRAVIDTRFDEVYQLAADMGGAGFIFTGENDADIMHNSATINLNVLDACYKRNIHTVFYSSSACVYPAYNQEDPDNPKCSEDSAYPAAPDSEYGWEKLFSERLYLAYRRNHGIADPCRALPQHLRPRGHLDRRAGEGAGSDLPQGGAWHGAAMRSRSGATAGRPARSSMSTNAWRAPRG